jgi:dTDP-L-rhamnose 4-epimerase
VADELLAHGYQVRALDNLTPQVHGVGAMRPYYLDPEVELVIGDVRDAEAVSRALDGIDAVCHCAAAVGVGQSMYEIARYVDINDRGTAVLLQALIDRPVEQLVVASSMSIYGEGLYLTPDGIEVSHVERSPRQVEAGMWEPCTAAGEPLTPVPTPEYKTPDLASVYALTKYDQERMCLIVGQAYGISTVALRLFNVFGPRQSLSNPYTGVLAIFASRLLNNNPPLIYEDGLQQRDLVSVFDVARAFRLALEVPGVSGRALNIASGHRYTVAQLAEKMAGALGIDHIAPEITRRYRVGDVRHCFADISQARLVLGYEPLMTLDESLGTLVDWLKGQTAEDRVPEAQAELQMRRLAI